MSMDAWVKPTPDTVCPNPVSDRYTGVSRGLRYSVGAPTITDMLYAASAMDAFATMATHPAGVEMLKRLRGAIGMATSAETTQLALKDALGDDRATELLFMIREELRADVLDHIKYHRMDPPEEQLGKLEDDLRAKWGMR